MNNKKLTVITLKIQTKTNYECYDYNDEDFERIDDDNFETNKNGYYRNLYVTFNVLICMLRVNLYVALNLSIKDST